MALPLLQLFAVFLYVVETQRDDFENDVDEDFFPVIGFRFLILHDRFVL